MIHFSVPTWAAVPLLFAAGIGFTIFVGNIIALAINLAWFGRRRHGP